MKYLLCRLDFNEYYLRKEHMEQDYGDDDDGYGSYDDEEEEDEEEEDYSGDDYD